MESLKTLALALASVCVALLLSELAVRATLGFVETGNVDRVEPSLATPSHLPGVHHLMKPGAAGIHRFPSDPQGRFDSDGSLTYRTNALGFRGPETSEAKPPGVFRIIGLGDSFTFGRGVRLEHTFLARLQRRLDEAPAAGRFEVLNWGTAGYDTVDEANLLKYRGPAFGPDLVILCFFLNDTRPGPMARPLLLEPGAAQGPGWRQRSALLDQLAARLTRRRRIRELVSDLHAAYGEAAPGWQRARAALRQARDQARAEEFDLVVMIFPVLWDLSGPSPFTDLHAQVADYAASLGLPVLDLLPVFAGHEGPELWAHPLDQHPGPLAHDLAASALFDFLVARHLVPLPASR